MSEPAGEPPLESVEVIEGEHIVERGSAEITWFFRHNEAWLHVSEWPQKEVTRLEAGPGTVWESRVTLALPRGTRLMRVESRPAPIERSDPLEHLKRSAPTPARRTGRRYFRVLRGGRLASDSG